MEFYEPVVYKEKAVRLNGVRRFDPDRIYEEGELEGNANGPAVDRYGFVGEHKQAS